MQQYYMSSPSSTELGKHTLPWRLYWGCDIVQWKLQIQKPGSTWFWMFLAKASWSSPSGSWRGGQLRHAVDHFAHTCSATSRATSVHWAHPSVWLGRSVPAWIRINRNVSQQPRVMAWGLHATLETIGRNLLQWLPTIATDGRDSLTNLQRGGQLIRSLSGNYRYLSLAWSPSRAWCSIWTWCLSKSDNCQPFLPS